MRHFKDVDFVGNRLRCVVGTDRCGELSDDLAAVAHGADIMDGDAGFGVTIGFYGFVHVVTPHALSAVLR